MRAIFTGFHLMYSRVFAETANGEQRKANSLFNLRQFMFVKPTEMVKCISQSRFV